MSPGSDGGGLSFDPTRNFWYHFHMGDLATQIAIQIGIVVTAIVVGLFDGDKETPTAPTPDKVACQPQEQPCPNDD